MPKQMFEPDWFSSPGDTISTLLSERGISTNKLALLLGFDEQFVSRLIAGDAEITIDTARRLESAVGVPAKFWLMRESQYRGALRTLQRGEGAISREEFVELMPIKEMIRLGWISRRDSDPVRACLEFFDVASIASWRRQYYDSLAITAFRTSPTFVSEPGAVAAWLRFGERECNSIPCKEWDVNRFQSAVTQVRALTREKRPEVFVPALRRAYAACGVAVIVQKAPTGCRASGAARFVSSRKALIMLSCRHLSDDHFWFTVFHESAHILLHGNRGVFVDGVSASSDEEREANDFAGSTLVPASERERMFSLAPTAREVMRFARDIGISPGIVVGQLQHFNHFRPSQLNDLKRRYHWP